MLSRVPERVVKVTRKVGLEYFSITWARTPLFLEKGLNLLSLTPFASTYRGEPIIDDESETTLYENSRLL
jgi:hypothetical protein